LIGEPEILDVSILAASFESCCLVADGAQKAFIPPVNLSEAPFQGPRGLGYNPFSKRIKEGCHEKKTVHF
jgi:hypothetical protein